MYHFPINKRSKPLRNLKPLGDFLIDLAGILLGRVALILGLRLLGRLVLFFIDFRIEVDFLFFFFFSFFLFLILFF